MGGSGTAATRTTCSRRRPPASCFPEPLTFVDGALVSCGFGTAYEGLLRAEVTGRDALLVTGLGPVGLAVAMLGRALGARTIVGSDPSVERVALAQRLGLVDHAVTLPEDLDDMVASATAGHGCEVAINCSGNSQAREAALRDTRGWGRCVFVGEGGTVTFAVSDLLIHKQIQLHGSWVTSLHHMEQLLTAGPVGATPGGRRHAPAPARRGGLGIPDRRRGECWQGVSGLAVGVRTSGRTACDGVGSDREHPRRPGRRPARQVSARQGRPRRAPPRRGSR